MPKISKVSAARYVHTAADLHAFQNPDKVIPVPETLRQEASRLADIAELAQFEYQAAIDAAAKSGASSADLVDMKAEMARAAEEFFRAYRPASLGAFTDSYALGTLGADIALWEQDVGEMPAGGFAVNFSAPDRAAIAAIANDNFGDLAGQTENMIEGAVGILRTEAGQILVAAVADGMNPGMAARHLEVELMARGFAPSDAMRRFQARVDQRTNPYNGVQLQKRVLRPIDAARFVSEGGMYSFVDRAGRQWDLRHYCEMASHTKLMIAKNEGARNRMRSAGVNHYMVSEHATDCPICEPFEGVVFWTGDGADLGYDEGPAIPLHPNCEHTTVPWVLEAHDG